MQNYYEKEKKLNPNGFWGIWSKLMLGKHAFDVCSLIWNTLFATILLPFWAFPGLIWNAIVYNKYTNKSEPDKSESES